MQLLTQSKMRILILKWMKIPKENTYIFVVTSDGVNITYSSPVITVEGLPNSYTKKKLINAENHEVPSKPLTTDYKFRTKI